MDIVNESFPVGKKLYLIEGEPFVTPIESLLNTKVYKALSLLSKYPLPCNDNFSVNTGISFVSQLELLDEELNEEFPKFKINSSHIFTQIHNWLTTNIIHKKATYQNINRIPRISNMPYFKGMIIQWDNIRKGIIVHNMPYEGELEVVKGSGISKYITGILNEIVAESGIFELLGESLFMGHTFKDSTLTDKAFKDTFEKFIRGTHSAEDVKEIAVRSGAYFLQYNSDVANANWTNARSSGNCYELKRSGNKPKISTVTRQILLYKYGGLKLPPDYNDWFDG